jgi:hypothetical protein
MPSTRASKATAPRSLADALRALPGDGLAALLARRPDLAMPLPPDLASLAGRAASRASVQRAMDALDSPALQVLDILALLPEPATPGNVSRLWGTPASTTLDRLRALALVWGSARSLHLVRAGRDVLGPHPAGLGPPLAETLDRRSPRRLADLAEDLGLTPGPDPTTTVARICEHLNRPDTLGALLAQAPDGVRALLGQLCWGPPVGQLSDADRTVRAEEAASPVDWLLAHGLLGVAGPGHVVLPREIGLALRGGRVHRAPDVEPPALVVEARPTQQVPATAASAAAGVVRLVDQLGQAWGRTPVPVLRAGGLGVRELRRWAQFLDVPAGEAARVIEIAYTAGIVGDDGEAEPRWAPTPVYDTWREGSVGERWAALAVAWLETTRCPGLVGTRDAKDGVRACLGPDLDRASAPQLRRWVLEQLCETAAVDPESLLSLLDWTAPRLAGRPREALVWWTFEEAGWLGVTAFGALAPHARPLLDLELAPHPVAPRTQTGTDTRAAKAADLLDSVLPAPVDHLLVQADLTAVAPGPLVTELDTFMGLTADVESRGGATVYRFTQESIRRALDAGLTSDEVLARLDRASRTGTPQPLTYLVTDTARRHGRIRVGAAQAYLRADDESLLTEILVDRRTAPLRLRRLAPTVLAAATTPGKVLDILRSMGLAPAAETADGDLLVRRPAEHRTLPRARPRPISELPPSPSPEALLGIARMLRATDETQRDRDDVESRELAVTGPPPALDPMDPAVALAVLREAATLHRPLWIAYVDATGTPSRRLVSPVSVEAGRVTAFDREAQEIRTFSVHRIIGVASA